MMRSALLRSAVKIRSIGLTSVDPHPSGAKRKKGKIQAPPASAHQLPCKAGEMLLLCCRGAGGSIALTYSSVCFLPWLLRQMQTSIFTRLLEADASPDGSPMQRITWYTLKALDMRRKGEGLDSTRGTYQMTAQVWRTDTLVGACIARWGGESTPAFPTPCAPV